MYFFQKNEFRHYNGIQWRNLVTNIRELLNRKSYVNLHSQRSGNAHQLCVYSKMYFVQVLSFFRERRRLASKINITFYHKLDTEYVIFKNFFQKSHIFRETGKNCFWGAKFLLRGRWRPTKKMNIIFFMENEVLNSFSSNNFFEESNIFGENSEKILKGTSAFFWRRGHLTPKMNITFFITN